MTRVTGALAALAVCLFAGTAHADARADLARAELLLENGKMGDARKILTGVYSDRSAPPSLRSRAALRLGCIDIENAEDAATVSSGRERFVQALMLDSGALPLDRWHPKCGEQFPPARAEADRRRKESAERTKLQQQIEAEKKRVRDAEEAAKKEREQREALAQKAREEGVKKPPPPPAPDPQREKDLAESRQRLQMLEEQSKRLAETQEKYERLSDELEAREKRMTELLRKLEEQKQNPTVVERERIIERRQAAPEPYERRLTIPVACVGGVSVLALGTGVFFGAQARSAHNAFLATPYQSEATTLAAQGRKNALVANISYGAAAGLAVTAVILYLVQGPPEPIVETAP